ncbi:MAG: septum formation initiator family protein [Candidatus Omnitrophica bacterium]|nr:septum formation initiator family protein [Candidatus Omnitrophota bacterium]
MHRRTQWMTFGAIILAVACGPLLLDLIDVSWKRYTMHRRLQRLEAFHQELTDEQQRLTSDPVYVEGLIRSTFKVAKPNEIVIPRDAFNEQDR